MQMVFHRHVHPYVGVRTQIIKASTNAQKPGPRSDAMKPIDTIDDVNTINSPIDNTINL